MLENLQFEKLNIGGTLLLFKYFNKSFFWFSLYNLYMLGSKGNVVVRALA